MECYNINALCSHIYQIDEEDDGIKFNQKISFIEDFFQKTVKNEAMLKDVFEVMNDYALKDADFGICFAILISSKVFDNMALNDCKVRNCMFTILQANFENAKKLKNENIEHFFNSIALLGEYYNRAKLHNGSPIRILGEKLFELLNKEFLEELKSGTINPKFAKLVLTQTTLNAYLSGSNHKNEMNDLLFTTRKCLIDVPNLPSDVKAFLLMTLDVYYSKFSSLGTKLETMYTKFLIDKNKKRKPVEKKIVESHGGTVNLKFIENMISNNLVVGEMMKKTLPRQDQDNVNRLMKTLPQNPKNDSTNDVQPKPPVRMSKYYENRKNLKTTEEINPILNEDEKKVTKTQSPPRKIDNEAKQDGSAGTSDILKTPPKLKAKVKTYFEEHNSENLTWDNCNTEEDSTSPKINNPYSQSFLKFLDGN